MSDIFYIHKPIDTSDVVLTYDVMELSESEKEYDRNTSLQTLKLIVKLGYRIVKDEN